MTMKRAARDVKGGYSRTKAQAVMSDMFLATLVFVILLTALMFTKSNYEQRLEGNLRQEELMAEAFQAAQILVSTPGIPENWETGQANATLLGLADRDRVLSDAKVEAFFNIDYPVSKEILRLDNFNLTLKQLDGTVRKTTAVIETDEVANAVRVERRVIYNGSITLFVLDVWE